ncbi:ABC transporter ATP-binding protein, partial [Octadecabacter sp.]|nr:ABC transporter ATP-binding protein [Octadecabacter sp.]
MIAQRYQKAIERLSGLIDSQMPADGPPPATLLHFFRWALSGAWPVIVLAGVISACSGASEVLAMFLLGRVVDIAASSDPIGQSAWLLGAAVVLLMVLRPLLFGISASFQSVVLGPNLFTLIVGRLHRWTLGQAVTFFDNDFAGRIA